jgi:hypothetical protein
MEPTLEFEAVGTAAQVSRARGRTGAGLRLMTAAGLYNNQFASTWKIMAPAAATYCLSAWIKSSAQTTVVRLTRFEASSGSGLNTEFAMPGPVSAWSKVPPNVKLDLRAQANDEITVGVFDKTETAGTVIELDDVDVWVSADGRCEEPRE